MNKKITFGTIAVLALIGWIVFMNNYAHSTEYRSANCNDVTSQPAISCTLAKDYYGFPFVFAEKSQRVTDGYQTVYDNQQAFLLDCLTIIGLPALLVWMYVFKVRK